MRLPHIVEYNYWVQSQGAAKDKICSLKNSRKRIQRCKIARSRDSIFKIKKQYFVEDLENVFFHLPLIVNLRNFIWPPF